MLDLLHFSFEGKRRNRESPSIAGKVPCRSGTKKARQRVKSSMASRRSTRATKRPAKYDNMHVVDYVSSSDYPTTGKDYVSSNDDPTTGKDSCTLQNGQVLRKNGSGIKRKVSVKQAEWNCSENCVKESPVNALSDALYSETSADSLLSGVQNNQPVPPVTSQTDHKVRSGTTIIASQTIFFI